MGRARIEKSDISNWSRVKIKLLYDILDLFDKYKVKYCMDGGTLLGIVRDGEIIHHDSDHDAFIKVEDIDDNFMKMMDEIANDPKYDFAWNKSVHRHYAKCFETGVWTSHSSFYKIMYTDHFMSGRFDKRVYCDLFVIFPLNDFYWYKLSNYRYRFKADHITSYKTIHAYKHDINIPVKVEDFLDIEYNNRWRVREKFNPYTTNFWHCFDKNEIPIDYCYKTTVH